ncbi:MAG: Glycogen debranching enzyme [Alphaproteobacteria bacterium ADurb.Bin438]|nr:MAG: Glycogen debranching enzyme [Alphaproteobacteria bacterium ADurb.Bin438]
MENESTYIDNLHDKRVDFVNNIDVGEIFDSKKEEVRFGFPSPDATKVDLCFYDKDDKETKVPMEKDDKGIWRYTLKNISKDLIDAEGLRCLYRVDGPYDPKKGLLFNYNKPVWNVYSNKIDKQHVWHDSMRVHKAGDIYTKDERDSAPYMPKCVVVDMKEILSKASNVRPNTPQNAKLIGEGHVRDLTKDCPFIPPEERGTLKALKHPKMIEHLKNMGYTRLELLPVCTSIDSPYLSEMREKTGNNLVNHFGYSTGLFNALDPRYGDWKDFVEVCNAYNKNGIGVIADIAFHSGEGGISDGNISFRGAGSNDYFKVYDEYVDAMNKEGKNHYNAQTANNKSVLIDDTGCGNVLDSNKEAVQRVMRNSFMTFAAAGVSGFRLDLLASLSKNKTGEFDENSGIYKVLDEPLLKPLEGYGEPWDIYSYYLEQIRTKTRLGPWSDIVRKDLKVWNCGGGGFSGAIAYHMSRMPPDKIHEVHLHENANNDPNVASVVNETTTHDGFTEYDYLVYRDRNNYANGENNRDGNSDPAAGYGDGNPKMLSKKLINSFITKVLLPGTPLVRLGTEFAKTQYGNNNPWNQDNKTSYINWEPLKPEFSELPKTMGYIMDMIKKYPQIKDTSSHHYFNVNGSQSYGNDVVGKNHLSLVSKGKEQDIIILMNSNDNEKIDWHNLPISPDTKSLNVLFSSGNQKMENVGAKVENSRYLVGESEIVFLIADKGKSNEMIKNHMLQQAQKHYRQ